MNVLYFWNPKEGEVLQVAPQIFEGRKIPPKYYGMYCVDADYPRSDSSMRYGKFFSYGWAPVELFNFPKEFKTALLLLGIPV